MADTILIDVPRDIWILIFELLDNNPMDIIRFSATCHACRSIVLSDPKNVYRLYSPSLLLRREKDSQTYDLFSLADPRRANEIHLPQLQNKLFLGSAYGWLITTDLSSGDISLLNPFNKAEISLPQLEPEPEPEPSSDISSRMFCMDVNKAVISGNPSKGKSFMVILITTWNYPTALCYCRPGDKKWTSLSQDHGDSFEDVIWHMGKFYAVTRDGELVTWNHWNAKAGVWTIIYPNERQFKLWTALSLVNSIDGTELLLVCSKDNNTFSVFKLDKASKKFVELQRLGDDQALFVSPRCTFSVSTLGSAHLLANCIYSSKCRHFTYEACVYNMDEKSTKKIYERRRVWNASCIWIIPSTNKSPHTKFRESKVRRGRKI